MYITGVDSVVGGEEEMRQPLDVAREFFLRPAEEKALLRIRQPDGARGYQVTPTLFSLWGRWGC